MLLIVEWHVTAIVHGSSFLLEIVLKCVEFLTFSLPLDTNSHHWCCCCYTKVWGIPNLVSYKCLASFPGLPTVQFWSLAVRKNEDGFFHIMSTWVERGGGGGRGAPNSCIHHVCFILHPHSLMTYCAQNRDGRPRRSRHVQDQERIKSWWLE